MKINRKTTISEEGQMFIKVRLFSYCVALISIVMGCLTAVARSGRLSELFGVVTFIFLAVGICIDVGTAIFGKSDL
jgi:hypothetical protein